MFALLFGCFFFETTETVSINCGSGDLHQKPLEKFILVYLGLILPLPSMKLKSTSVNFLNSPTVQRKSIHNVKQNLIKCVTDIERFSA
jgi:hypothetical protein